MRIHDYKIHRKDNDSVSVIIQYIHRIVNNNKDPYSWTEEERNHPRIFDKQIQTYITLEATPTMANSVTSSSSIKMLSGGNFDFKDSSGPGYLLKLQYKEYDEAVKEIVKSIREEFNFSCIPGKSSAYCFLPSKVADETGKTALIETLYKFIQEHLEELKKTNQ
jgi:hypothetical protein